MPEFVITIKIRTAKPPHESLGSEYRVVSLSILDPYRQLRETLKKMPTTEDLPDAESA